MPEAKLIWEEYRYRHDLCWKLIFQPTIAVVAILVISLFVLYRSAKVIEAWDGLG